jgi:hypothetical protein
MIKKGLTSQFIPHCEGFISNRKAKAIRREAIEKAKANLLANVKQGKELREIKHQLKVNKPLSVAMEKVYNGEGMRKGRVALPARAMFRLNGIKTSLVISNNCVKPLQSDKPLHLERHIEKQRLKEIALAERRAERKAEALELKESKDYLLDKEQREYFAKYGIEF